ncbi:hypothetical protein GH714_002823 [Hevea brasiliensis]|uniref:Uncharacterized protein n=1 Tax=Hevea brasiliensis TaxID=3981 RepID=A0A6A6KIR7_HEVBR|nr:hypothetical protein GH714_002823 [Hevea brasiliensis]
MKSYLQAFDLWDSVENNTDPTPLPENLTLAQIKIHNEERAKKYKAKTCIESSVSETIFIKIMACENAKEAWDLLKEEYEGNDQIRILRNSLTYNGADCFSRLKGVPTSAPAVLMAIMLEENKLQAVMVELAAEVFKFMSSQESSMMFKRAGVKEAELPSTIVQILKKHENPSTKVPRIRRFAIGLAIWMMRENAQNVHIFKDLRLEKELEHISETTVELENFNIFSGTVGLSRQSTTIHSLVGTAMKLLEERQNHATEQ